MMPENERKASLLLIYTGGTIGMRQDPKNPPAKIEMWGGNALGGNYIRTATTLPIYETAKNKPNSTAKTNYFQL